MASSAAVGAGTGVGLFYETQSSKGGRYTVTLPNGTKVEEVNKITAAQMVPFDSIKFTGNYGNMTEISYQTAKRAAKKGQNTTTSPASGRNVAVTSPLAPTCISNRFQLLKRRHRVAFYIFARRHCMRSRHSVKSRALA